MYALQPMVRWCGPMRSAWICRLVILGTFLGTAGSSAQSPRRKGEPDREASAKDVARELMDAHNRERAAQKLDPLTLDPKLNDAARRHAVDMAEHRKMSHDGSDGSKPAERVKREGYLHQATGENVAYGQRTVAEVMRTWMNSPHHRDNILGQYTQLGVAEAFDENGVPYWCVDFGTPWTKVEPARAATDLVAAINEARGAENQPALRADARLTEAAQAIASALAKADTLDLTKVEGADLASAIKSTGYRYRKLAEAAAAGQASAKDVVTTWMTSPPHKANVIGDFTEVGVGHGSASTGTPYWCVLLARPQAGD